MENSNEKLLDHIAIISKELLFFNKSDKVPESEIYSSSPSENKIINQVVFGKTKPH